MNTVFDPRMLYHLHIIYETGSLSAAADLLAVSQPTLSRTVTVLETQAGCQLMVRGRNGVILTEAGILLAEQGRKIASDLKQADEILQSLRTNSPPTLRVGVGPLLALAAVNDFVSDELTSAHKTSFHLQINTARQLITDLLHNRLDIAIMTTPIDMRVEHLTNTPVCQDRIGLFTGAGSPFLTGEQKVAPESLATAKWVTIEASFGPKSSHENMIKQFGLHDIVPAVQYNMNIQGMLDALCHLNALCFLPARLTALLTADLDIQEIPLGINSENREIGIWYSADAELNQELAATIRRCKLFLTQRLT